jgi:hypothetical protein
MEPKHLKELTLVTIEMDNEASETIKEALLMAVSYQYEGWEDENSSLLRFAVSLNDTNEIYLKLNAVSILFVLDIKSVRVCTPAANSLLRADNIGEAELLFAAKDGLLHLEEHIKEFFRSCPRNHSLLNLNN